MRNIMETVVLQKVFSQTPLSVTYRGTPYRPFRYSDPDFVPSLQFCLCSGVQQFSMTAYDRIAAGKKKRTKSFQPQFSSESERNEFVSKITLHDQWLHNEHDPQAAPPKSRTNILRPPQPLVEAPNTSQQQSKLRPTLHKKSEASANQVIDLPARTTAMLNNRKSVTFQEFTGIDDNPLGKRDGLELRGEEMSVRDNVRYLLGEHTVRTNEGQWRIVEIGEAVEENIIASSRALLVVWQLLPRILYGDGKPYWLIAIILAFVVRANQNGGWLLALFIFTVALEIGLHLVQINGKIQFGRDADSRMCKKFDFAEKQWKQTPYEGLTAGDLIRLMPEDEFPCDSLLLQSPTSRLVGAREEASKGRYTPITLKQTVLSKCLDIPMSGLVYLRSDVDMQHITQWAGKVQLNSAAYNISYKNFAHRGSINQDASDLVCVVLYTMCNQKQLQGVQYPIPIKPKRLEKRLSYALTLMAVVGLVFSAFEAAINFLFSEITPATSHLDISPDVVLSLTFMAKYICEFTVLVPIFIKLAYLAYGLASARLIEKDPFFKGQLKFGDSLCAQQLGQTKLLVADMKTLYYRKQMRLKSLRIKQLTYNIGEDTDFMLPKDVDMTMDFLSAAYLSCQEMEDTCQKAAILDSGKKFGMNRDFSSSTVRLREDSEYLTAELIKEHPYTDYRPFSMTFYREARNNRILCITRGNSEYIVGKLYSRQSEISKMTRRLEQEQLYTTELLGKAQVSNFQFQQFIGLLETGPLANLNDLLLQMLRNTQLLGVLVYQNPHLDESQQLCDAFHQAQIANLLLCPTTAAKNCFIKQLKLASSSINEENVVEESDSCLNDSLRREIKVLQGDSLSMIKDTGKADFLVKAVQGNAITILVDYTESQLAELLGLLKSRDVPTCSLVEDENNLLLLKQCDVGVAIAASNQPYLDRHRYCDVRIGCLRHFLKLLFAHARNSHLSTSKLLLFLLQKSFMLFVCELAYSFYTLCTAIPLIASADENLLEVWLLSFLPVAFYLFEGDYSYNTLIKHTKLFRSAEQEHFFGAKNILKAFAVSALQGLAILFVVVYSLAEPVDSVGTIKGHEVTQFLVFFCVFHVLLFKLLVSGERITWHQALIVLGGLPLYYVTIAIFCSPTVANAIDLGHRSILSSVFSGRSFLIGVVVCLEAGILDLMVVLNHRVFHKGGPRLQKAKKEEKELSQQQLIVQDLPQ